MGPPQQHGVSLDLRLHTTTHQRDGRRPASPSAAAAAVESVCEHQHGGGREAFACNYCHRKFFSSQALGGHQKTHKLERTLAKRSRDAAATPSSPAVAHSWLRLHGGGELWAHAASSSPAASIGMGMGGWAGTLSLSTTTAGGEATAEMDLSLRL